MVKVGHIYSIFIILGIVSLSSTLYTVKNGETGKYRYYLQGHQQYRVCCYCPLKAVMYDDINEAFQVEDCVKNSSEKDEFGQTLYPFCSCEAKMELTPRFIGCTLPETSNVEWDCENGYVFPNVSVYTTCEPRCQDNNMILVKQGTESYRCNEDKQWENNPTTVSCKYEEKKLDITSIIVICSMAGPGIIVFILIIVCWRRKWYQTCLTFKGKCNSSSDGYGISSMDIELSALDGQPSVTGTNSQSQSTAETECSLITETSPVRNNMGEDSETSPVPVQNSLNEDSTLNNSIANDDSVKDVEMKEEDSNRSDDKERVPLLNQSCSNGITDDMQIVKVNGSPEVRGDKIYYNVVLGHEVLIATNIKIERKSDFTVDRECGVQCHYFLFSLKNVQKEHEGIYNWRVKEGGKDQIRQGRFYLCVNDSERQDPVGGDGSVSLECSSLNLNSFATIEERVVEASGPGTCSHQNEAVLCRTTGFSSVSNHSQEEEENASISSSRQESVSPVLTNNNQGTNSGHNESASTITEKCKNCNATLSDALQDHTSSQHLYNMCSMLDPKTKNDSLCWIGFLKFYRKALDIKVFHIENIRYHKKGNPEDGHMQYIINSLLPPHGFTIGHIVYYFSRKNCRREDVLSEIQKFHTNCLFCDKYLNPSTTCSIS